MRGNDARAIQLLGEAIVWWDKAEEHIETQSLGTARVCIKAAIGIMGEALECATDRKVCRALVEQLGGMVDCDTWLRQQQAETVL